MSLLSAESTLGSTVSIEQLAALRVVGVDSVPLHPALQGAATIDEARLRTQLLMRILVEHARDPELLQLLISIWASARSDERSGMRLLASLLDVRLSGLELLREMLRPTQMIRMCALWKRPGAPWAVSESIVMSAQALAGKIGLKPEDLSQNPRDALEHFHSRALDLLNRMLIGALRTFDVAWLRELADTELRAQARRLELLAERIGAYDGRRISRVLPLLSRQEERIRDTQAILMQWPETDALRLRTPVLLENLEAKGYDKLVRDLDSTPGGRQIAYALKLLRARTPLSEELGFLAAVLRYVDSQSRPKGGGRLDAAHCMLLAMQLGRHTGRFSLLLGSSEAQRCRPFIRRLNLVMEGDLLHVAYEASRHEAFLAPDGTAVLEDQAQPRTEMRDLVMANIGNEHILCGLLKQPRVVASPGLVETIVRRTRSIKVLLEIANRRDLYSGYANRNVPIALLEHPAGIPLSALRKFVHVGFVNRPDLQALAARGSRARPEVRRQVGEYLKSLLPS